ncbi:hypothetical protein QJQ45_026393, partial [Haematococcus lacustris]
MSISQVSYRRLVSPMLPGWRRLLGTRPACRPALPCLAVATRHTRNEPSSRNSTDGRPVKRADSRYSLAPRSSRPEDSRSGNSRSQGSTRADPKADDEDKRLFGRGDSRQQERVRQPVGAREYGDRDERGGREGSGSRGSFGRSFSAVNSRGSSSSSRVAAPYAERSRDRTASSVRRDEGDSYPSTRDGSKPPR